MFNYRLHCKEDNYNEATRMRHVLRGFGPVDYKEHIKRLANELQAHGIDLPEHFDKSKYL